MGQGIIKESESATRTFLAVLMVACGLLLLFCAPVWRAAEVRTHACLFACAFGYSSTGSSACLDVAPPPGTGVAAIIVAMTGAFLMGSAFLVAKRRYSLLGLILVVLATAAGGLPFAARREFVSVGYLRAAFSPSLSKEDTEELQKRLSPEEAVKSKEAGFNGISAVLRNELLLVSVVGEENLRFEIRFAQNISLRHRYELSEFYIRYFEAITSEIAVRNGLQPIGQNRTRRVLEH